MTIVRDYSTQAMIQLLESDKPNVEYLKDALRHYIAVYGNLLERSEKVNELVRIAKPAAQDIFESLVEAEAYS